MQTLTTLTLSRARRNDSVKCWLTAAAASADSFRTLPRSNRSSCSRCNRSCSLRSFFNLSLTACSLWSRSRSTFSLSIRSRSCRSRSLRSLLKGKSYGY